MGFYDILVPGNTNISNAAHFLTAFVICIYLHMFLFKKLLRYTNICDNLQSKKQIHLPITD